LPAPREVLAGRLRFQAQGCTELGSPFYGALLESAALDLEAGGAVWEALEGFEQEPEWSALALRLMGAVHRLVLQDRLPQLAPHYPSVGGDGDASSAWPAFRDALPEHCTQIRRLIASGCQTNEVGRSAALLGGFLEVAHRTRLPLRILEIGASAGLNLRWDRYRYESGETGWGDEHSRVRFVNVFDVPPPLDRVAEVVERKGCDLQPIDPTTDEGALTLRSFIWADQLGRLSRLDGAIEIAGAGRAQGEPKIAPAIVERLDAATFLERELDAPRADVATVVYHSVFIQYLTDGVHRRITGAIDQAISRATPDAPVYHLSMEPDEGRFEVRLGDELLGTSRAHGTGIRWLAP
jgi:hypothetical protein